MRIQNISPSFLTKNLNNVNNSSNPINNSTKNLELSSRVNPSVLAAINFTGKKEQQEAIVYNFIHTNDKVIKILDDEKDLLDDVSDIKINASSCLGRGQYLLAKSYYELSNAKKDVTRMFSQIDEDNGVKYIKAPAGKEIIVGKKGGEVVFAAQFADGVLEKASMTVSQNQRDYFIYDKQGQLVEYQEGRPVVESSYAPFSKWYKFKNGKLSSFSTGYIRNIPDSTRTFNIISLSKEYIFNRNGDVSLISTDKKIYEIDGSERTASVDTCYAYKNDALAGVVKGLKNKNDGTVMCHEEYHFNDYGISRYRRNLFKSQNEKTAELMYEFDAEDKTTGRVSFEYESKPDSITAKEVYTVNKGKTTYLMKDCEFVGGKIGYKHIEQC